MESRGEVARVELHKHLMLVHRFLDKVKPCAFKECWIWTGSVMGRRGFQYGHFRHPKTNKAHRASWMMFRGEIPETSGPHGTCVCHKCDNPICVNPHHLFLGTNRDNAIDMTRKGRNHLCFGRQSESTKAKKSESMMKLRAARRGNWLLKAPNCFKKIEEAKP